MKVTKGLDKAILFILKNHVNPAHPEKNIFIKGLTYVRHLGFTLMSKT